MCDFQQLEPLFEFLAIYFNFNLPLLSIKVIMNLWVYTILATND